MTNIATSLRALATNSPDLWGWIAIGLLAASIAFFIYSEYRRDQWLEAMTPESDPDRIVAARAEENRRTLAHIEATDGAAIAKRKVRERTRAMNRRLWIEATDVEQGDNVVEFPRQGGGAA